MIALEAQKKLAGGETTGIDRANITRLGGAQDHDLILRPSGARGRVAYQSGGFTTG